MSTQKNDSSQVKVRESISVQEVGPNQEVETQVHNFPMMECDFLRLVIQVQRMTGVRIKMDSKMLLKSGNKI